MATPDMATLCILNLANSRSPGRVDADINKFADLSAPNRIGTPGDIPVSDAPLVLYIVGHAVPNGLIDTNGDVLDEVELAKIIREKRDDKPTLIVWDVCFAKTFLQLADSGRWPDNYVHVFSCQEYERTWHAGKKDGRKSFFSTAFRQACQEKTGKPTWDGIQERLREAFGSIQTPEVSYPRAYEPDLFKLATLA